MLVLRKMRLPDHLLVLAAALHDSICKMFNFVGWGCRTLTWRAASSKGVPFVWEHLYNVPRPAETLARGLRRQNGMVVRKAVLRPAADAAKREGSRAQDIRT